MSITKIIYAGHSAVFIELSSSTQGMRTVAIDPWLDGNPRCPEKLRKPSKIDVIVLTHGHSDHAGDAVRLAKHYGATVVATWELAMLMIEEGVPQSNISPMNKGGTIEVDGIRITLTHALHSSSYDTKNGPRYAGEACGVVIRNETSSIYHAGDTALFSDMTLIRDSYKPDVALLPIGDRFTMGPKEAALAVKLIQPKYVVPIHYKTFDLLTGDAEEFRNSVLAQPETKDVKVCVVEPGEELEI